MKADSPGAVMTRIGAIEDALYMIEADYYTAVRDELLLAEFLKTAKANLAAHAEGDTIPERAAWVERKLRNSDDFAKWVTTKADKASFNTHFELLSKRLSACQSVLKRHELTANTPGLGRGQVNS